MEKRYSHGLNFLANYTWQKNMEEGGSGPSAFTQNGGTSIALMPTICRARRPGAYRRGAHLQLRLSYGYELPWGPGKRWLSGGGPVGKVDRRMAGERHHHAARRLPHRHSHQSPAADLQHVQRTRSRERRAHASARTAAARINSSTPPRFACPAPRPATPVLPSSSLAIPLVAWPAARFGQLRFLALQAP